MKLLFNFLGDFWEALDEMVSFQYSKPCISLHCILLYVLRSLKVKLIDVETRHRLQILGTNNDLRDTVRGILEGNERFLHFVSLCVYLYFTSINSVF